MEERIGKERGIESYEKIFQNAEGKEDIEAKARAFDKIAEKYYFCNFGSISKTDIDVLMFSIYIERILDKSQEDFNSYSDYTLSKNLGITQSKISSFKVKKELQYPYAKFNWRERLAAISQNAIYEDGKIKLHIPDKNIYLEIKNAVEQSGGYIETQLNSNLLQIKPAFFIDLMLAVCEESEKENYRKEIKRLIAENTEEDADAKEFIESVPIGQMLRNEAPELIASIISDFVPVLKGSTKELVQNVLKTLIRQMKVTGQEDKK